MAHYINILTDNSAIAVDDATQQWAVQTEGQSFHLVVQDVNNGANGAAGLLTYSPSPESNSASFQHQSTGSSQQSAAINQGQNVYIINTEPVHPQHSNKLDQPPPLIPVKDHHTTPRIIRSVSKVLMNNPGERQDVQWIQTDFKNQPPVVMKNQTQKTAAALAHLEQGTSEKFTPKLTKSRSRISVPVMVTQTNTTISELSSPGVTKNVTINKNATPTFRLKGVISNHLTPKPRLPIRHESPGAQIRPTITAAAAAAAAAAGLRNSPISNNPPLESLSERIKQTKLQTPRRPMTAMPQHQQQHQQQQPQTIQLANNILQKTTVRPSFSTPRPRPSFNLRTSNTPMIHHQRPIPQCPVAPEASSPVTPVKMDIYPNFSPVKTSSSDQSGASGDTDSGSESFAYLQKVIDNPANAIVQQQITGNVVKMLVVLPSGEQRLITFDIPQEECTVQDLLEQANIPSNGQTIVSLVTDTILNINYIVESEAGVIATMRDTSESSETTESSPTTITEECNNATPVTQHEEPKFIDGRLAVCPNCGISSMDFNRCTRCKKKLPSDVKQVQTTTSPQQKKEFMISITNYYKKKQNEQHKFERDLASKRPRGRPRAVSAKVRPIKEPECLTLSSDDEDDGGNSPAKKPEVRNMTPLDAHMNLMPDFPDMISDKEPIITNNPSVNADVTVQNTELGSFKSDPNNGEAPPLLNEIKLPNSLQTSLVCRTVRIGSYKYVPRDKVVINRTGLVLAVPLLEDNNRLVHIQVKLTDIVKVLIHFGKGMPVLFFYTTPTCGANIRELLGMQDSKGPYYDPASKDHTHKRITLLPEKITEESKHICKALFTLGKNLDELSTKEANDILVRASPKNNTQIHNLIKKPVNPTTPVNPSTTNGRQNERVVQKMTVYPPPPAKSGIAINTEDYSCLGEDQFLNDVIIDFYLKYLTLEVLSEVDQHRTHVFSSYFYKRLTSRHAQAPESNSTLSAAAKRHARVQKWTKNVNIFEKDFIIIPINEHAHWFLAIICFPGLVGTVVPVTSPIRDPEVKKKKKKEVKLQTVTIGSTTITPVATTITLDPADDDSERDEAEGDDDEMEMESDDEEEEIRPEISSQSESSQISVQSSDSSQQSSKDSEMNSVIKSPCILIFDSLAGASRSRVVATLRDYLSCEHLAKVGCEKVFSKDTIKGACPKVPQQSNFTDCGLYVLQYVESFFKDPVKNYTLPIKTLKNWFEEIIVTRKREELSNLLIKLMNNTKGDKTINLPTVQFPTQDGKLKPKSENPEKPEQKVVKAEPESKKKSITDDEQSSNSQQQQTQQQPQQQPQQQQHQHQQHSETREPGEIVTTIARTKTIYKIVHGSSALTSNPAEVNSIEANKPLAVGGMMNFLRNKRISRLVSREEVLEHAAAKKHKGDSLDSCK